MNEDGKDHACKGFSHVITMIEKATWAKVFATGGMALYCGIIVANLCLILFD